MEMVILAGLAGFGRFGSKSEILLILIKRRTSALGALGNFILNLYRVPTNNRQSRIPHLVFHESVFSQCILFKKKIDNSGSNLSLLTLHLKRSARMSQLGEVGCSFNLGRLLKSFVENSLVRARKLNLPPADKGGNRLLGLRNVIRGDHGRRL